TAVVDGQVEGHERPQHQGGGKLLLRANGREERAAGGPAERVPPAAGTSPAARQPSFFPNAVTLYARPMLARDRICDPPVRPSIRCSTGRLTRSADLQDDAEPETVVVGLGFVAPADRAAAVAG